MALPSAVQAISDNAEKLAEQAGMKGGKPVEPVQIPEKPAEKVDPENWEERYKRYRAATDVTLGEQRKTIDTLNSTVANLQAQIAEMGKPPATPETPATDGYEAWLEKVPQRMKDEYTEEYLRDQYELSQINKGDNDAIKELEDRLDGALEVQHQTAGEKYEAAMDKAFPNDAWITMASGDKWAEFCAKPISPVDNRTYGQLVKEGSDAFNANTVIWVLTEYQKSLDGQPEPATETDPRETLLTPEGGGDGGDPQQQINAQAETYTQSQVNQFFKDVATTKKYTAEEATTIEKSIIAAQAAGKIIPG